MKLDNEQTATCVYSAWVVAPSIELIRSQLTDNVCKRLVDPEFTPAKPGSPRERKNDLAFRIRRDLAGAIASIRTVAHIMNISDGSSSYVRKTRPKLDDAVSHLSSALKVLTEAEDLIPCIRKSKNGCDDDQETPSQRTKNHKALNDEYQKANSHIQPAIIILATVHQDACENRDKSFEHEKRRYDLTKIWPFLKSLFMKS